jgi:hypothetical protein
MVAGIEAELVQTGSAAWMTLTASLPWLAIRWSATGERRSSNV